MISIFADFSLIFSDNIDSWTRQTVRVSFRKIWLRNDVNDTFFRRRNWQIFENHHISAWWKGQNGQLKKYFRQRYF
jgi:hypothetical protein